MISERPAEVEDRAVPGHWEGDLFVGKNSQHRDPGRASTRYAMLAHPGRPRRAVTAVLAPGGHATRAPARSLTWDQGKEMADHADFTIATDIPVYFCDPHSPWQRGTNENTNGLLRQYFPKGTGLASYTQDELDAVANQLNGRPRQTLNWQTPAKRLEQLLVATTGRDRQAHRYIDAAAVGVTR